MGSFSPSFTGRGEGLVQAGQGNEGLTQAFLQLLPSFCDAEKVENFALENLVQLAAIYNNTQSNYLTIVTVLP